MLQESYYGFGQLEHVLASASGRHRLSSPVWHTSSPAAWVHKPPAMKTEKAPTTTYCCLQMFGHKREESLPSQNCSRSKQFRCWPSNPPARGSSQPWSSSPPSRCAGPGLRSGRSLTSSVIANPTSRIRFQSENRLANTYVWQINHTKSSRNTYA